MESHVDRAVLDAVGEVVSVGEFLEGDGGPLERAAVVVPVGGQVDVVGGERLDGVRTGEHVVAAGVLAVDHEDPLGEDGVHHMGGALGLDPNLPVALRNRRNGAQGRPSVGVLRVELRQIVRHVPSVDRGSVGVAFVPPTRLFAAIASRSVTRPNADLRRVVQDGIDEPAVFGGVCDQVENVCVDHRRLPPDG